MGVVGEPMVVELSVARTTPKWIVALPMPHVGWPNPWSKLDFAAGLVQVAYAIGVAEPLSICVMDYGTSSKTQEELTAIVRKNFDLRPGKIVKDLNLKAPIFQSTSTYGHFGRPEFNWEK